MHCKIYIVSQYYQFNLSKTQTYHIKKTFILGRTKKKSLNIYSLSFIIERTNILLINWYCNWQDKGFTYYIYIYWFFIFDCLAQVVAYAACMKEFLNAVLLVIVCRIDLLGYLSYINMFDCIAAFWWWLGLRSLDQKKITTILKYLHKIYLLFASKLARNEILHLSDNNKGRK